MNANDLRIVLFSVQGEINTIITDLLGMFCIEHKHHLSKHKSKALSEVLSGSYHKLSSIHSLKFISNKRKIYIDPNISNPIIKPQINIKEIDTSFAIDIIRSIEGFPLFEDTTIQSISCVYSATDKCGSCPRQKCNKCKKESCKHICKHCGKTKYECYKDSMICCRKCTCCFKCSKSKPKKRRCKFMNFYVGVEVMTNIRHLISHYTEVQGADFLSGSYRFSEFRDCVGWDDLKKRIMETCTDVLNYMCDQKFFKQQKSLSVETRKKTLNKLGTIINGNASFLKEHFSKNIAKIITFIDEEKCDKGLVWLRDEILESIKIEVSNHTETLIKNQEEHKAEIIKGQEDIKKCVTQNTVSPNVNVIYLIFPKQLYDAHQRAEHKGKMKSDQTISKDINGYRLSMLCDKAREIALKMFHLQFPEEPEDLFYTMKKHECQLKRMLRDDEISNAQFGLLLPDCCKTYSELFNITLIIILLKTFCIVKTPSTGSKILPLESDRSVAANIVRIDYATRTIRQLPLKVRDELFIQIVKYLEGPLIDLGISSKELDDIKCFEFGDDIQDIVKTVAKAVFAAALLASILIGIFTVFLTSILC